MMKVCKGVKRDKTDHASIVFDDEGYREDGSSYPLGCPLCSAIRCFQQDGTTIEEMHNIALAREDYIAKIESENTKLREAKGGFLPMFEVSTVTINQPTVKTTKTTKKKTTKKTT